MKQEKSMTHRQEPTAKRLIPFSENKMIAITILVLWFISPLSAVETLKNKPITLAKVLEMSTRSDQVKAAEWRVKSHFQDSEIFRRQLVLPAARFQSSFNMRNKSIQIDTPGGPLPLGKTTGFQLGASLYQPIYKPGGRGYQMPALQKMTESADLELQYQKLESAREAAFAFFDLLIIQSQHATSTAFIVDLEKQLKQAETMVKAGRLLTSDKMKIELGLLQAKHTQLSLEKLEGIQQLKLRQSIRSDVHVRPEWDLDKNLPDMPDLIKLLAKGTENRQDLKAVMAVRDSLVLQEKATSSERLPELNALASYSYSEGEPFDVDGIWETRLQLSWKPFESGTRSARKAKIRAEKESVTHSIESIKTGIVLQLQASLANLEISMNAVELSDASWELAQETLRVEQERFKNQRTTVNDLLEAETQLFQQEMARHIERLNFWKTYFDTFINAGIIWDGTQDALL